MLIIIAIFSSFYVNENSKNGSVLLMIVGILILLYSASFFDPYEMLFGSIDINIIYVYPVLLSSNLGSLSGIIISFTGIYGIIKKLAIIED